MKGPGRPRDPGLDRAILAATIEVLCQEGFAGTTVEAVAERAGVGKATIYRRWATREHLLMAAGGEMGPCPGDPDLGNLRDDLLVLTGGLMAMAINSPIRGLLPAVIEEAARNPELRLRFDAHIAARRAPMREALARAEGRGELRPGIDHELLVDMLAGAVFTRLLITGGALHVGLTEQIVDLVLGGGGAGGYFSPARPRMAE